MPRLLLEVIVQTVEDAIEAAAGGADRLEVVRDIRLGGLTPPLSVVRAIAAATALPLRVMVRENAGYGTAAAELPALDAAAAAFRELGVDGLVVGFAKDGELALHPLAAVRRRAPGVRLTFHRAFDQLRHPLEGIDALSAVWGVDSILTSGGDGPAAVRCARLREYVERADGRLTIIAGGGVDEEALALFARAGCVREVHVGRAARRGGVQEAPVSADCVRRLRELAG